MQPEHGRKRTTRGLGRMVDARLPGSGMGDLDVVRIRAERRERTEHPDQRQVPGARDTARQEASDGLVLRIEGALGHGDLRGWRRE